jgi:hypothetical protein
MPVVDFHVRDVVRLRKPHPCGGFEWEVYRLGADIGLRCLTCGHRVMLARPVLEKRLKKFVSRGPEIPLSLFFPNLAPREEGQPSTAEADERGGEEDRASPLRADERGGEESLASTAGAGEHGGEDG